MSQAWPLDATEDDDTPLPPPWDGDVRFDNQQTESELLALQYREPALALRICRQVFCRAEARGDQGAATHALYLAFVNLFNSGQQAQADRVLPLVRARAAGMDPSQLSVRIELAHAVRLTQQGEHAQAMVVRQRALDLAMLFGDLRVIFLAIGSLAVSAAEAGESALVLSLCEQQESLLTEDDSVIASMRHYHANTKAMAWQQIARASEAVGQRTEAQAALEQARALSQSACASANNDKQTLHCLDTLVQALLLLNQPIEARAQVERCVARLDAVPVVGSELWCARELAQKRIDVYEGKADAQTVETLRTIEASVGQGGTDVELGDVQQVLLQAQEQLGHAEQALASHKRASRWRAQRRSAQSRQRLKVLRHTVLAMKAEAMEFITHDLMTPLAAAQTWVQALQRDRVSAATAAPLRQARRGLAQATALSEQGLALLRAELLPRTHLQLLDIGALADDVCESMAAAALPGKRLTRAIDIGTPVLGDATLLTKALVALLADALDGAPDGGRVEVRLQHDSVHGEAVLSITHAGPGLTRPARIHLYQQLAGSEMRRGKLGLALAAKACRLHRMRLRFEDLPGTGSRVQLTMRTAPDHAKALAALLHNDADL